MKPWAYRAGVYDAFEKFALSPGVEHALELGGLGLLGAYPTHELITGPKEDRPKHLTELAGLGVLGIPTLSKILTH